ncbi:MAG: hypothetical protein J5574_06925 [Lachnospiraceae bacterium]|nr:hypothetical protein [Lachnospiraceae bacterium]
MRKNEVPFIAKPLVYILIAFGLSGVDATVLYGLMNLAMQQNEVMGYLMAFAVAMVLNVLPLVIAHYIHHMIYKTRRFALVAVAACTVTFVVLFATTVNLRYEYRDLYGEGSVEKIVNAVETDEAVEDAAAAKPQDAKAMAVFWLLALEPLATSIMNLMLGLMGDNYMRKHIYELRIRQVELCEAKSDCEAALADMNMDIDRMIEIDKEKSFVMKEKIGELEKTLKAVARQVLAEELGDPSSISKLCGQMTEDTDEGELENVVTEMKPVELSSEHSGPYPVIA